MKKIAKFMAIVTALTFVIPFTSVNAATKTDTLVEKLKESAKSFDGTVTYENDTIEIEWNTPNSKSSEISFSYNGNIIEYNSGEITSYEQAEEVTNHSLYAIYLIEAALRVNGYTDTQINEYFSSSDNDFDYEINGIEFKNTGEAKKITSPDGYSTITVSPRSIKIDVTKANLNKSSDDEFTSKETTIEDIVSNLQSDSEFTTTEYEGKVVYENEIESDDNTITINHTYYWEDYHNILFTVEDGIITYEDDEIEDYFDAERALSHQLYALQILMIALKNNGYTTEQIQEFFQSEDSEFNYELNGIEIKKTGEAKEYEQNSSSGSSSITVSPMSIKIDLSKANLKTSSDNEEKTTYKVLEGEGQTLNISNNGQLTFRFDIEYSKFKEDGKVYIDGSLVDSTNYTSKEGSTIITFNSDYTKNLSAKEHTLKVAVANGEVSTTFTVTKNQATNTQTSLSPQTGDNIVIYISLLSLGIIGIATVFYKKRKMLFN